MTTPARVQLSYVFPYRAGWVLTLLLLALAGHSGGSAQTPATLAVGATSGSGLARLDSANSYVYNFGITSAGAGDYTLSKLNVVVDKGNNVSENILIEVFSGAGATGSLVGSQSVSPAGIAASASTVTTITFTTPVQLPAGVYSIRISTAAPTTTNGSYGFRNNTAATLQNASGTIIASSDWIQDTNTTGTATTTLTVASPVSAEATLSSTTVNFGRYHVGAVLSQDLTLRNTALTTSQTESLKATAQAPTGAATIADLTTANLTAQASDVFQIGMSSSGSGAQSGAVTLNFSSVATGGGLTALPSQQVTVSGTGYTGQATWAQAGSASWGNFVHWDATGGTPGLDGALSVNDTATFGAAIGGADATISLDGAMPVLTALTFNHAGASYTIAPGSGGSITLGTGATTATVTNSAGSHTISANLTLANATQVHTESGTSLTLSGAISGAQDLTKTGLGILTLSGLNTYSGHTVVNAGTLAVSGALQNATLTIAHGATLAGTGTFGGSTTIAGLHAIGTTPGLQTFTHLTYNAGASVAWRLAANSTAGRGTNFDGFNATGNLTFGGATALTLDFSGAGSTVSWNDAFWSTGQTWTLHSVGGTTTGIGNLNLTVASWSDKDGTLLNTIHPNAGFLLGLGANGNDVVLNYSLTAVPEPSTYALIGGLATLGVALHRRRRRAGVTASPESVLPPTARSEAN